jgi:hypothetical protein
MVGAGLHILLESYMLYATSKAISSFGEGETNAKTYFVHALGLIVSLGVEASFFLAKPPARGPPRGPADHPDDHAPPVDEPSTSETDPAPALWLVLNL